MKTAITRRNRLRNPALSGAGLLSLRDRRSRSGSHHAEWGQSRKGTGKACSGFKMVGPLTEFMWLVNLTTLAEGQVEFDAISGRALNAKAASQLLHRDCRKEWSL